MIEPNQTRLEHFDNVNQHREILHRGCSDVEKRVTNARMMLMNANGFRIQHEEKIAQMTEFCKNNQIDAVTLSETNGKQKTRATCLMRSKMKALSIETRCYHAERKDHKQQTPTGFKEDG